MLPVSDQNNVFHVAGDSGDDVEYEVDDSEAEDGDPQHTEHPGDILKARLLKKLQKLCNEACRTRSLLLLV